VNYNKKHGHTETPLRISKATFKHILHVTDLCKAMYIPLLELCVV
jgi:hypothetical protein